jgi:hypothetical protein
VDLHPANGKAPDLSGVFSVFQIRNICSPSQRQFVFVPDPTLSMPIVL